MIPFGVKCTIKLSTVLDVKCVCERGTQLPLCHQIPLTVPTYFWINVDQLNCGFPLFFMPPAQRTPPHRYRESVMLLRTNVWTAVAVCVLVKFASVCVLRTVATAAWRWGIPAAWCQAGNAPLRASHQRKPGVSLAGCVEPVAFVLKTWLLGLKLPSASRQSDDEGYRTRTTCTSVEVTYIGWLL